MELTMSDITHSHDDDDGFGGSVTSGGRLIKGAILRWNETNGWLDRDGLRPPEMLLVLACTEALQCWRGKKPVETITSKPLPDVAALNDAAPQAEWEPGLDNRPKPPWVHQVIIYLINPADAGFFTYLNATVGARIAFDVLREKVITMRALRGTRVVPLVRLTHRPMKTAFGMKHRPEFEVVGWRNLGGDGGALPAPNAPQLSGPVTAEAKPETAKPEASVTGEAAKTIATLGEVSIPTTGEQLADEIPW
jgi:hypothetical protein